MKPGHSILAAIAGVMLATAGNPAADETGRGVAPQAGGAAPAGRPAQTAAANEESGEARRAAPEPAAAAPAAGDPAPAPGVADGAQAASGSSPWLGLRVAKVVPELRSQVPDLPPGVGFTVERIDAGGPAESAGLRRHDVIWQMDGQLLVNEAQLAVLLGLRRPGQVVELDYFRAARPRRLQLKLGAAPPGFVLSVDEVGERVVIAPPDRKMPVRIVDVPTRTATIDNMDGRAVLTRTEGGYEATITDRDGRTVWQGAVPREGAPDKVPVAWRERVVSLRDTLAQASPCRHRPPRLRIVPPGG
jgi:hypothetical protein